MINIIKKIKNLTYKEILIIVLFILGFIFCLNYRNKDLYENFGVRGKCYNLLVRNGTKLRLINTQQPNVPGVNPIDFNDLEEYVSFVKWQKKNNINCPILYFQETYNTQGMKGYRLLDDPLNPNAGLTSTPPIQTNEPAAVLTDSGRDNPNFNQNQFAGYDKMNQNIGVNTPLDDIKMVDDKSPSPNPMAKNWGGHKVTIDAVNQGKFKDRTRDIDNNLQETNNILDN